MNVIDPFSYLSAQCSFDQKKHQSFRKHVFVYLQLALFAAGIAICFVLGILFIVCMPCIGCFFCCCRICGNCGGKLKTTKQPKANLYCRCLSVSLLLVSATLT